MIALVVEPGLAAARSLTRIKSLAWDHPGEHRLRIVVGEQRIDLGELWTYDGSPACMAALEEFGQVARTPD